MQSILLIFFLLAFYNLVNCHHDNVELKTTSGMHESELVSSLSREAYRNFSVDLVRDFLLVRKLASSNVTLEGISLWSIAHMLSVIHEKIWFVHTNGFDQILHLKPEEIHRSYREIARLLFDDQELHMHSNIYTSRKGMVTTKNIDELKTKINYINYDEPNTNKAIEQINDVISDETFGKINDGLVPLGGWYGASVYNYTLGVFISTFQFSSKWLHPFTSIGMKSFGSEQFKFLEAVGNFDVYHQKSHTAVRIPLKHKGKSLILIKHNKSGEKAFESFLDKDFNEFLEKMEQPQTNTLKNIRQIKLQVPAFNFSKTNSEFKYALYHLGLSKSICRYKLDTVNTLESFAQSFYGHLGEDKFEAASASGSSLTDVNHFQQTYGITPDDTELHGSVIATSVEITTEQYDSQPTFPPSKVVAENKEKVTNAPSIEHKRNFREINGTENLNSATGPKPTSIQESSPETVVFDTPFIWYLQDDNLGLGPLLLGIVKGSAEVEEKPDPGFEWLLDVQKFHLWSCPDRPISALFSNAI